MTSEREMRKRNRDDRLEAEQEQWPWGGERQQGELIEAAELRKQAADRISTLEELLKAERSQTVQLKARLWEAEATVTTQAEEIAARQRRQQDLQVRADQGVARTRRAGRVTEELRMKLQEAEETVKRLWENARASVKLAGEAKDRGLFLHPGSARKRRRTGTWRTAEQHT
jgi:chromosome segregation ATPase